MERSLLLAVLLPLLAEADFRSFMEGHGELLASCIPEGSSLTPEAALEAWKGEDESEDAKCHLGCVFEKITLVVDGLFHPENAKALAQVHYQEDPTELEKAESAVEECGEEVNSKGTCATGYELLQCFIHKKDKYGLQ